MRESQEWLRFTPAERRILPLLATYLTLSGIADGLGVRRSTVKTHVVNIYRKLGVTNRTQAVERAEERGLLEAVSAADRGAIQWRAAGD
ncbi:MAG: LuxR C-terminal-related transcriptional regulator [Solirubrobacteraceae bacterium]